MPLEHNFSIVESPDPFKAGVLIPIDKRCAEKGSDYARLHDCCIRVIALLEYFEWTLSKQHSRSKGQGCGFSVPLFYPC